MKRINNVVLLLPLSFQWILIIILYPLFPSTLHYCRLTPAAEYEGSNIILRLSIDQVRRAPLEVFFCLIQIQSTHRKPLNHPAHISSSSLPQKFKLNLRFKICLHISVPHLLNYLFILLFFLLFCSLHSLGITLNIVVIVSSTFCDLFPNLDNLFRRFSDRFQTKPIIGQEIYIYLKSHINFPLI